MTEASPGPTGNRRIDRVLAENYLDGIATLPMDEVRSLRKEAEQEETDLSYLRRLLQGRLDILRAELARRSGATSGTLVDALPALLRAVPGAHVVIAGDGPLRDKLEAAVPESLRKNIIFTGHFDEEDRLALLSASTVVALPAIGGESFGITLAEAMAARRPVVASSIPGYAAVARNGGPWPKQMTCGSSAARRTTDSRF